MVETEDELCKLMKESDLEMDKLLNKFVFRIQIIFFISLVTFMIIFSFLTKAHAGQYDGNWQVVIQTENGTCDRLTYAYADIVGTLVYPRNPFGPQGARNASGAVNSAGRISASYNGINVRGKLTSRAGAGRWKHPSKKCSGSWTAFNRS